jgi:hypothetical protein
MKFQDRITGTGITRRRASRLLMVEDGVLKENSRHATQPGFGGLDEYVAVTTAWATGVLAAASLPTTAGSYVILAGGQYQCVDSMSRDDLAKLGHAGRHVFTLDQLVTTKQGHEPDSAEGYAAWLLQCLHWMERSRSLGNTDSALEWAMRFAELATEARMKFRWECHALRGQKNAGKLVENQQQANASRQAEAEARRKDWQAIADLIWARRPGASKELVAREVRKELQRQNDRLRQELGAEDAQERLHPLMSSGVIARALKNPRQAC